MKPSIFLGTPNTKELVSTIYATAVAQVGYELGRRGIPFEHLIMDGHDVATQRDKIADQFLATNATHLLMIDSDIGVNAAVVMELLSLAKPFIGVACPWRNFNYSRAGKVVAAGLSIEDALSLSYNFNIQAPNGFEGRNGRLLKAPYVGFGVALIERQCFEQIAIIPNILRYANRPGSPSITGYFQRCVDENGELLPEDFSFCKRWRDAGGDVWVFPFADIQHTGPYTHRGNLATQMTAFKRQP